MGHKEAITSLNFFTYEASQDIASETFQTKREIGQSLKVLITCSKDSVVKFWDLER